MIELRQITVTHGETQFVFDYDLEGKTISIIINKRDLNEKLKALRDLLGRDLTLQDLKDVIKSVITQIRKGETPFQQDFDYSELIGVDLEV
ncbi:MAG: hypothetical protein H3Z53_09325 [archaeon]|nr:hypothetical protein [archaeon]MCP8314555.1 hypothetical protein [archaeon]MCP8316901.1 hypothetical protein [archaeon]MCP8320936.1 hypothetical protein [archaeon]